MKTLIACITLLGILPAAVAELTSDDFEAGHILGMPPVGWSTKNDTNDVPVQANLLAVEANVGRDTSQGLALDVTQAKRNYLTINSNGVSGSTLYLSVDLQIATTGEALTNAPSGINASFIGPVVSTNPDWESSSLFSFGLMRREDDFLGFFLPGSPFVDGYFNNSTIGLAPGLTASTSDWFTVTMTLTDDGTNWTAFVEAYADGEALPFYQSLSYTLFAFPSGVPLYGGFSTGWNTHDEPIGNIAKVSAITLDNVLFGGSSIEIKSIRVQDMTGYSFLSITGSTHRLQYALDGVHYLDTGASVVGDGSTKTLIDLAADTSGRTYRVTSD